MSGSGSDSVVGGNITAGDGNDTIYNNYGVINAGAGANFVSVYANNWNEKNIKTGSGKDTINSDGEKFYIESGAGDDSINLYNGNDSTVYTGAGNDSIVV